MRHGLALVVGILAVVVAAQFLWPTPLVVAGKASVHCPARPHNSCPVVSGVVRP